MAQTGSESGAKAPPMSLASVRFYNSDTADRTFIKYDQMQVRPDRTITWYTTRYNKKKRTQAQQEALNKRGQYNGQLSRATKSKLNKWLLNWMQALQHHITENKRNRKKCKYWPVFVTLTLSDRQRIEEGETDNYIKRTLLNTFIQDCKRNHGVENYLWRAEAQKNGNIHFHLIIDRYIDRHTLQSKWNRIQKKFVDRYTERTGKTEPPSTQIQSIRNYGRVSMYATKYALKEPGTDYTPRKIEGRIWGCSDQIRCIEAWTRSKLDDERPVIEAELKKIDHILVENWAKNDGYCWIKLTIPAWNQLKILQSSLLDHYADEYKKLYKDQEYQDYRATLHRQEAKRALLIQKLEFQKAIFNRDERLQRIQDSTAVQITVRHPKIDRLANSAKYRLRQYVG
jgi:hypothetical protein